MVCHALARVSAATMSTTMRLRSSMVRVPPSHCGCATPIGLLYNLQGDLHNISVSAGIDFSLENGWKAADGTVFRASVATLVLPTESPLNWGCARWSEGSLSGHWRSGVAFVQVSCRSTRRGVREHPAPSGALRPVTCAFALMMRSVREHPAPSGALRRAPVRRLPGQGLPLSGITRHHQVH